MARRRRRGDGSVFYRKGKGWVAQVTYRGLDGKRHFLTRLLPDERTAKLALPALLVRAGADRELADPRRTLDAFLAEWLERVQVAIAPSTFRSYAMHVRVHLSPLLGGIPVEDLRAVDVDRLVRDRQKAGLAPASIQRVLATLSMALEQSVREGTLPRNVVRFVKRPKVVRDEIEAMTTKELDAVLAAVEGDRLEALYALLVGTGLRLGEAVALNWEDVDLDEGMVRVRAGKTPAARRVAVMAPFAITALRRHRAAAKVVGPKLPIFTGERKGERLRGDVAYRQFHELLERAGLPPMRVHDLRHGHATLLLSRGTPMRVIADQLGHTDPALTAKVYAHVAEEQRRAAVRGLGEGPSRTGRLTG